MPKNRAYQKLLFHLVAYFKEHETFDGKQFGTGLPQELGDSYSICLLLPLPPVQEGEEYIDEIRKTSRSLRDMYLRKRLKEIGQEIKKKEEEGQEAEIEQLRTEFSTLVSELKK